MSQHFPKPCRSFGGNINVDLSNYATKTDLKNVTHVDTSSFALKTNLAGLKTEADKLDIGKLVPVLVDLSNLTDVMKSKICYTTKSIFIFINKLSFHTGNIVKLQ